MARPVRKTRWEEMMAEETPTCKRTLDFSIPFAEVEAEADKVVGNLQKKVKLPGFRPGKIPPAVIRKRYEGDVYNEALQSLISRVFNERAKQEELNVVGTPNIKDVHFHKGKPLTFSADFEVAPEFELGEYTDLTVAYEEPSVSDDDVEKRLAGLREQKAEYVNIDPRPAQDGDYAVVAMKSTAGVEGKPIENDEMILHVGDPETMPAFSDALRGLSPGEEIDAELEYPEDYGHDQLAGRKVTFHLQLNAIRKKELPELNDEFAQDVGDFQNMEELRAEVRKTLLREGETMAQAAAKNSLVETLVDTHDFAIPDAYVDRQIESNLESRLRELAAQGVDPRKLKIDWEELRKSQAEKAARDVRASLLLGKVADRESISVTQEELDREVQRAARQMREPVAAVRMKLEKDGTLGRIVSRIVTDKVLNFLFERARKVAPETVAADGSEETGTDAAEVDGGETAAG
ncbi:MAG: trigger factor [Bryobacteraceae bacterium]